MVAANSKKLGECRMSFNFDEIHGRQFIDPVNSKYLGLIWPERMLSLQKKKITIELSLSMLVWKVIWKKYGHFLRIH